MGLDWLQNEVVTFPEKKKLVIKTKITPQPQQQQHPQWPFINSDIPSTPPKSPKSPKSPCKSRPETPRFGDLMGEVEDSLYFVETMNRVLMYETPDVRDHYSLGKELGRGHFGVVRQCEDKLTLEMCACKSIDKANLKKKEEIRELQAEIGVMEHVSGHVNVVMLKNVFEDEQAVHLVMELCKEGDLFDYIARRKRLPEAEAARIFRQATLAVEFCHSRNIVHRDLKPENILFSSVPASDGRGEFAVKLADFGLAAMVEPGATVQGMVGSPFYMAPELVRRFPYGRKIDVWSLGVVLYTALSGFLPFWGKTHEDTFASICRGEPDLSKKPWPSITPEAKSLVRKMLTMDPARRASIPDILGHPWILTHCSKTAGALNRPRPLSPRPAPNPFCFQMGAPGMDGVSANGQPMEEDEEGRGGIQQALSAPKGQFSPPRLDPPSPGPNRVPPKFSLSQLLPTPPGTPNSQGGPAHLSPFAAALTQPFRMLHDHVQQQQQDKRLQEMMRHIQQQVDHGHATGTGTGTGTGAAVPGTQ